MDYKRIYRNIIHRAKSENRKKSKEVYYERHHIVPVFMFKDNLRSKQNNGHLEGNPDDKRNIVLLTPREHFLCHVLLYKIFKGTRYEYKCGAALMLFFNVAEAKHKRVSSGGFHSLGRRYERYRKIGLQSISNARKGTFPCVDAKTGESVGSLTRDHPKVISGEYVHHSKGKHTYYDPKSGERVWTSTKDERVVRGELLPVSADNAGSNNSNYLAGLDKETMERIVMEVYSEHSDNRSVFSDQGHIHKKNFYSFVYEKLSVMYPNRKAFTIVAKERLGEPITQFLNRKTGKTFKDCTLKDKFPKEKKC